MTDDNYTQVAEHLQAIIAEATVARCILQPRGLHDDVLPDGMVEALATDDRHQEAREAVRKAASALEDAGLGFALRAGIEASYEGLLAVTMQQMWEQRA